MNTAIQSSTPALFNKSAIIAIAILTAIATVVQAVGFNNAPGFYPTLALLIPALMAAVSVRTGAAAINKDAHGVNWSATGHYGSLLWRMVLTYFVMRVFLMVANDVVESDGAVLVTFVVCYFGGGFFGYWLGQKLAVLFPTKAA